MLSITSLLPLLALLTPTLSSPTPVATSTLSSTWPTFSGLHLGPGPVVIPNKNCFVTQEIFSTYSPGAFTLTLHPVNSNTPPVEDIKFLPQYGTYAAGILSSGVSKSLRLQDGSLNFDGSAAVSAYIVTPIDRSRFREIRFGSGKGHVEVEGYHRCINGFARVVLRPAEGLQFCLKAAAKKGDYGLWVRGAEGVDPDCVEVYAVVENV